MASSSPTNIPAALIHACGLSDGQFEGALRVEIPFDFIVGTTTLPAGQYTIPRSHLLEKALSIEGTDSRASVMVLPASVHTSKIQNKSKLVFNRYGNQYFLCQIWTQGDSTGAELMKSSTERQLAKNGVKAERTTVAVPNR